MEEALSGIENCRDFLPQYDVQPDETWKATHINYKEEPRVSVHVFIPFTLTATTLPLEEEFRSLAEKWREETGGYSLTYRRYAHPAYHDILALEAKAIPLILRELQRRPDFWFEALRLLTGTNPAKTAKTFDDAVLSWLEWGKREGHIR